MTSDVVHHMASSSGNSGHGNLDEMERKLSLAAGAGLVLGSLVRRPLRRLILIAGGGYLIYRGVTGHCPLSELVMQGDTPSSPETKQRPAKQDELFGRDQSHERVRWEPPAGVDTVDEAVMESFPASDPPMFTGASATRSDSVHEHRDRLQTP